MSETSKETALTSVFDGVTITYYRHDNKWHFELRGRHRSAESLVKAEEYIAKPVEPKARVFVAFTAWKQDAYGGEFKKVKVTGLAESSGWGNEPEAWITYSDGSRKRVLQKTLYADTERNAGLIVEYNGLRCTITELLRKRDEYQTRLDKIERFKDEE